MSDAINEIDNYEMVSIYHLNPEDQERLLLTQKECVFNWCTKDEWPVGVIMSYIWRKGRVWLTGGIHRHRMAAIQRNPKVSVVVTSTGTALGPGKTITIKGKVVVHKDRETKEWFYPDFALALRGDPEAAKKFHEFLDSPLRVVLEVIPDKFITYDGAKMAAHTAGTLDPKQLRAPLESDAVRLKRALEAEEGK